MNAIIKLIDFWFDFCLCTQVPIYFFGICLLAGITFKGAMNWLFKQLSARFRFGTSISLLFFGCFIGATVAAIVIPKL